MSLIAQVLEKRGIPTLILGSALDIMQAGRPPRAVFLDYPLGHSSGKPHEPADQYAVVRAALSAFDGITEPGMIRPLPNRWAADDAWKTAAMPTSGGDTRQPRDTSPQYQFPEDRLAAEAAGSR